MKFAKSKMWSATFAMVATMFMVGCTDPTPITPDGPMPEPENAIVLKKAAAFFKGDEFGKKTAQYSIALYSEAMTINNDWSFSGKGELLWFELNGKMPTDLRNLNIAEGTYNPIDPETTYAQYTFTRGIGDGEGSFYAKVDGPNEEQDPIVQGTVNVSFDGTKYKFIVQVKTQSGKDLVYKFEDVLKIEAFGAPIPPTEFAGTFVNARGVYYGDYYKVKYGNYLLELTDIPEGVRVAGHLLGLDINAALEVSQKDIAIRPGEYKFDDSQTYNTPMTFNAAVLDGQYIHGSYWAEYNSEGGTDGAILVTGGKFSIEDIGSGNFKVVAEVELSDGTTRKGNYQGPIITTDGTCLSRMEGDVVLDKFTKGMMVYRGDVEYTMADAYNWAVLLATDGIDMNQREGSGDLMLLDINTPKSFTAELPEGTFEVIRKLENSYLVPFTYIPGYFDQLRQMPAGTWYRKDAGFTAPGISGLITIKKLAAGAGYDIKFNLRDDYHYSNRGLGNKIDGSYSGQLTYLDAVPKDPNASIAKAPYVMEQSYAKQGKKLITVAASQLNK